MILYICSIVTSAKTRTVSSKVGKNKTLVIGVAFSIAASLMLYLNPDTEAVFTLVIAASFIGVSQAIIMNSVINFICEVIGARSEKGASVFG
jgi:Na+/melibiose symporter-like transporter